MRLKSAIEDTILNRTFIFENFFCPVFISVCGLFLSAIENAIEKKFASRIIAFYLCPRKSDDSRLIMIKKLKNKK